MLSSCILFYPKSAQGFYDKKMADFCQVHSLSTFWKQPILLLLIQDDALIFRYELAPPSWSKSLSVNGTGFAWLVVREDARICIHREY